MSQVQEISVCGDGSGNQQNRRTGYGGGTTADGAGKKS